MKILFGAVVGSVLLIGSSNAGEVSRSGTIVGPNGGETTYERTRSCNDGHCTFNSQATGPNGGNWNRSGTADRLAPGEWGYTRQTTGPRGRSWKRSGKVYFSR